MSVARRRRSGDRLGLGYRLAGVSGVGKAPANPSSLPRPDAFGHARISLARRDVGRGRTFGNRNIKCRERAGVTSRLHLTTAEDIRLLSGIFATFHNFDLGAQGHVQRRARAGHARRGVSLATRLVLRVVCRALADGVRRSSAAGSNKTWTLAMANATSMSPARCASVFYTPGPSYSLSLCEGQLVMLTWALPWDGAFWLPIGQSQLPAETPSWFDKHTIQGCDLKEFPLYLMKDPGCHNNGHPLGGQSGTCGLTRACAKFSVKYTPGNSLPATDPEKLFTLPSRSRLERDTSLECGQDRVVC
ncbi:hypothetical protein Bbelb_161490 [Branchiostoma belcheri]|nr:hypothetical protein Bbelb_161490 [Branchiostoma belcheri]